jgi:hypothetical protein
MSWNFRPNPPHGELLLGELAVVTGEASSQIVDRWVVSDQHHGVDPLGESTRAKQPAITRVTRTRSPIRPA